MEGVYEWAKQHPWAAGLLTLGAIFILLWLLGFFGSSSSSTTSSNSNNLAAAYYQAEAAQTTAGTQLQMATEAYAAQTAQDQIQATAATGIATTQANMYTTIGGQNAGVETALGNDQLLASDNANDDALAASNTAANFAYQTAAGANQAGLMTTFMNSIVNPELQLTGGLASGNIAGLGQFSIMPNVGVPNILALEQQGYTSAGAAAIAGMPYPGYTV